MIRAMTSSSSAKPVINNRDLLALKAYITAKDATQYDHVAASTVIVDLTHSNLIQKHIEIRFDLHDPVSKLRQVIYRKTGTSPSFQHLLIKSCGQVLAEILPNHDDNRPLGYFGLMHGMEIHCVDRNPHSISRQGQLEDTRLVEKYVMSDQDYNDRKGTLRDWERQQKAQDPTFTLAKHARRHRELAEAQRQHKLGLPLPEGFYVDRSTGQVMREDDTEEECKSSSLETKDSAMSTSDSGPETVVGIETGMRCQVEPGSRRGKVVFVGAVPELGGYWVGVQFDEPVGKTDGTVSGGKRYFETLPKYGGFVRGKNIQVGDFPERDLLEDDDDSDEDEL